MLSEILSCNIDEPVNVDIVKNVPLTKERFPYAAENIEFRELDASDWQKSRHTKYLLGVVKPSTKRIVYNYFSDNYGIGYKDYTTLLHPTSIVASTVRIENGVIINPGVIIAPYVTVEKHTFINRQVSIGHHTLIGEFSQINPAVSIAGHCSIGKDTVIGIGARIIENVSIGDNVIIGAGSLVTGAIPDNVVAYGVPAKVIRENS